MLMEIMLERLNRALKQETSFQIPLIGVWWRYGGRRLDDDRELGVGALVTLGDRQKVYSNPWNTP